MTMIFIRFLYFFFLLSFLLLRILVFLCTNTQDTPGSPLVYTMLYNLFICFRCNYMYMVMLYTDFPFLFLPVYLQNQILLVRLTSVTTCTFSSVRQLLNT